MGGGCVRGSSEALTVQHVPLGSLHCIGGRPHAGGHGDGHHVALGLAGFICSMSRPQLSSTTAGGHAVNPAQCITNACQPPDLRSTS